MKKKLLIYIFALLICVALPFSAAAQTEKPTGEPEIAIASSEADAAAGDTSAPVLSPDTPSEDVLPDDALPDASVLDGENETPFSDAFAAFFGDYLSEIFCVLTFIGSMLCAFLYKTGLMPLVRSGITSLGDRVKKNGDDTATFIEGAGSTLKAIEESLAPTAEALEAAQRLTAECETRYAALLELLAHEAEDHKKTREILLTETELFYQMLQSVALPQAQKESMTESYYLLKRRLEEGK